MVRLVRNAGPRACGVGGIEPALARAGFGLELTSDASDRRCCLLCLCGRRRMGNRGLVWQAVYVGCCSTTREITVLSRRGIGVNAFATEWP